MEMEQPKRGFPQCRGQLLMCSGGERVTFNSVGMSGPSDRLEYATADAPAHTQSDCSIACLNGGTDGEGVRGMGLRAEGVISASLHLAAVRGDKQENQYSHSGQFTTRASLRAAICQSQSLKRDGMGTADKVGVRAH